VLGSVKKALNMNTSVNILAVDDDRQIADMLKEYLTGRGYAVTAVYGGREALETFSAGDFHIVIVDMNMPEVDGIAVLKQIRKMDRSAVVIMITGYATVDTAVTAINNGAYDYIAKPFKWEELEVVLRRAIERHRSMKQLGLYRSLLWLAAVPVLILVGMLLLRFF
jgi:two-component system, NtrC family, response regulator AtoC